MVKERGEKMQKQEVVPFCSFSEWLKRDKKSLEKSMKKVW